MLEFQSLLLQPWVPGVAPGAPYARMRTIVEAAGRRPVGSAREPLPAAWWRRWWARPVLEVYESADEPLVFTVQRYWSLGPIWEVRDADRHPVGRFHHNCVEDALGRPLAWLLPRPAGPAGHWVAPQGGELCTVSRLPQGTLVQFAASLDRDPLTKMALLAAVLCREGA